MKKLLIIVGAVVAIIVIAIIVVPLFLSADSYKGQILARVRDATGRDMTIGGPLSLSLFPDVRVEASDVVLANAPGAATPAMAKLKKLDVAVKLIPLLSGRFEVERLSLVDPQIDLEIDAQGRPSWSFAESAATLPAPASGAVPPKNPSMMGLAALSRLEVKDVSISNGTIVLLDRRTNQRDELQNVALTVSAPSLDAPFTMNGSAIWRGQKVTISAKLDNTGALVRSGGKSGMTLALDAKPIVLKLAGSVANSGEGAHGGLAFDGKVDLAVPSVRDLVAWSGRPVALPKRGLGALALSGKVHAENGIAKFDDASFSLDGIKASGALTLDATQAHPKITGALHASTMDLNPYLPPPTPGWSSDPFDVAPLREVNAELNLTSDGLTFRKMKIGKSDGAVHLQDGRLTLDIREVALYRGEGRGTVKLDATGATPAATVDGSAAGVDLGSLLRDAGGGASINGSASFTVSVTARGDSERALVSTVNGKSTFRMSNGTLHGVDLGGMLKNTTSAFSSGGGVTSVERASATFAIRNGTMTTRDLAVSTSSVDATGGGTVNLPPRTLNFRIEPKLIAGLVTVPVIVGGPWDNLSYQPDLTGIAKGLVQTPGKVIGGAATGVGKIGQGVGSTFNSLFGK